MISGGGRTLMNLHGRILDGRLRAHLAVVVASRPCAGADRARAAGLATVVLGPDASLEQVVELWRAYRVDWVVLAGYLRKAPVPPEFAGRVVNIHPALLPEFGGPGMYGHRVHEAVLRAGVRESGCTVHLCDDHYDTGPVVLQRRCPVLPGDTPDTLAARVFAEECEALPEALTRLFERPARAERDATPRGGGATRLAAALLAGVLSLSSARAQPSPTPPIAPSQTVEPMPAHDPQAEKQAEEPEQSLEQRAIDAFVRKDYEQAERLLRQQIGQNLGGFVPHYNLACLLATTGRLDAAAESLLRAVELGYSDVRQLRRDTTIAPLREHATFRALVAKWPEILERRRDTDIRLTRELIGGRLTESRDDELRLVYLSAFDEAVTAHARGELRALAAWARGVLPVPDPAEAPLDPWIVIVMPNRAGFARWSAASYGPAALNQFYAIGGAYMHDDKRLVSMDLGATLRHEFLHVLHWRHMDVTGQRHPVWVQEGLCSLVEDFDTIKEPNGTTRLEPSESWRTNIAKRRERNGSLLPIEVLTKMPRERFTGYRPLANYAIARTFFLFLWREKKLPEWYAQYTKSYDQDPSGVAALESVFREPAKEIDKRFRQFVRELPEAAEEITRGMASLGVEVEAGDGDGVRVTGVTAPSGARSPAVRRGVDGELRPGDVLRAINGRPTRDMAELVRVLGAYRPGDTVEVEYRRGRKIESSKFQLEPKL